MKKQTLKKESSRGKDEIALWLPFDPLEVSSLSPFSLFLLHTVYKRVKKEIKIRKKVLELV